MHNTTSHQAGHRIFSLVLRRMRAPLILLISIYAIAILGFVLIPGQDDQGDTWHMSFFHSFYFVSYMATTIGFGEIPYAFTEAQRLWAVFTIYLTVIGWLYAVGKILTLIQDPALKRAVIENRFSAQVRQLREPFYIVCGYGDTGSLVIKALTQRNFRVVAIDIKQERINELLLDELRLFVPAITADAGEPYILQAAGLNSPHCVGILSLTDDDDTNLKVAITSKLLNPPLPVICRAESKDTQNNMASFGTDHIINPFDAFAEQMAIALHSPDMHLIFEWLTNMPGSPLAEREDPPHGRWIICGYGRFGRAMIDYLHLEQIETTVIEPHPEKAGCKPGSYIFGLGTEAVTLEEADIHSASGVVAGTNDDANNLSILMTAKQLKPDIYTVARQNRRRNGMIFKAAKVDQVMQHSVVLTLRILALLTAPLLSEFLDKARRNSNQWALALLGQLSGVCNNQVPDIWTITIDSHTAPTVIQGINQGREIRLSHLTADPRRFKAQLPCLPLMLRRNHTDTLQPDSSFLIEPGDQILFCGRYGSAQQMEWTLQNYNAMRYIVSGETRPEGWIWKLLRKV